MTQRVTKAVIPAAGLGTRFLPASKAVPKEMAVLVDKPTIQYIVEEAVAAGITDVLIITGRNKVAIEDHFDRSFELETTLRASGKAELADEMTKISDLANVHFIRQLEPKGLGHAVLRARDHVGDEPFAVMLGDDVMHARSPLFSSMLDAQEKYQRSVIALKDVPREDIRLYGCAAVETQVEDDLVKIADLVEKPAVDVAPSTLAIIGRYVLTPDIFDILETTQPGAGGEIQVTDALAVLARTTGLYGRTFEWGRFDVGLKIDYLRATVELALERPEFGPEFRKFLHEILARDEE